MGAGSSSSPMGAKTTTEEACLGADLTGQLAIVTGCSAGIGIATVAQLVKQGCTVVMANRNLEKTQKAKEKILTDLGMIPAKTSSTTETTEETKDSNPDDKDSKPDDKDSKPDDKDKTQDTTQNKDENEKDDKENKEMDAVATEDTAGDVLIPLTLDLSSLQSVYDFMESFVALKLETPLSLVVNNAGVMAIDTFKTSQDGYEMQFATNVLGHFYLSLLLINHFQSDFRIVNVSSSAHSTAPKNLKEMMDNGIKNKDGPSKDDYGAWSNYGISKLGAILMSREIAERYGGSDVGNICSYSLHPGVIMTELSRNMPGYQQKMLSLWGGLMAKTIPQGAATTIYCCCQDKENLVNGEYYVDCQEAFTNKLDKRFRKGVAGVKELQVLQWEWCELLISEKGFKLAMPGDDYKKVVTVADDTKESKENDVNDDANEDNNGVKEEAPKDDNNDNDKTGGDGDGDVAVAEQTTDNQGDDNENAGKE